MPKKTTSKRKQQSPVRLLVLSLAAGFLLVHHYTARSPSLDDKAAVRKQRRIFIDLGVNCGNSYYNFMDGGVEGSRTTLTVGEDWETYLWEPNPQMIDWYLKDLVKSEQQKGRKVTLIPKAAAAQNGDITFYLTKGLDLGSAKEDDPYSQCDPHSAYSPAAASTIFGTAHLAGQNITVEAVDFLEWYKQLNIQAGDIVHVKMDIEGAELGILEAFLKDETNQICTWTLFWAEYHELLWNEGSPEFLQHQAFKKAFPSRFEDKCGRLPWPNGILN